MLPDTSRERRFRDGRCMPNTSQCDRDPRRSRYHRSPTANRYRSRYRRSDREVESAEPEAVWTSSCEPPYMAAAKSAGEAAMLPRMIHVVMSIVAAGIMTNPLFALVHRSEEHTSELQS